MTEAQRLELKTEVAEFRARAEKARTEALAPDHPPWRYGLLSDTADYYDRRADDTERQLLAAIPAAPAARLRAGG